MPSTHTPLRYPGGKSQVFTQVSSIIEANGLESHTYVEPFAGGGGLALKLLFRGVVSSLVMNDIDPAIANFWQTVLSKPDFICSKLRSTPVTIESWEEQRAIFLDHSLEWTPEHAFATLFLNRTSRSGILRGGPIGGRAQSGKVKLNARLTETTIANLTRKIQRIAEHRECITVVSADASELLNDLDADDGPYFIYADPPYIGKGAALYHNSFVDRDHRSFGETIQASRHPFIVSYDEHPLALEIYETLNRRFLELNYSLSERQRKTEYLFFSPGLRVPESLESDER